MRYKYLAAINPAKKTPHSAPKVVAVSSRIARRILVSLSFRKGAALAHAAVHLKFPSPASRPAMRASTA
jgi:hypothetical protein